MLIGQVGAGIQVPPNSGKLLRRWGVMKHLDPWLARPGSINFRRWQNGAIIGYTDLGESFQDDFQEPYTVVHRAHFHEALVKTAIDFGVEMRLGCKVVEYVANKGAVVLEGGQRVRGDLIVAADGRQRRQS